MASAALRRCLGRCGSLRRFLHSDAPSSAAADSSFRRSFSSGNGEGESMDNNFIEQLFGKKSSNESPLFQKLDGIGISRERYDMGSGMGGVWDRSNYKYGDRSDRRTPEGFDSLNDGLDKELDNAARTFPFTDEIHDDNYSFRPGENFRRGTTDKIQELNLQGPALQRPRPRPQFKTSTKEVLRKADFRNVRFLQKFLTEAGIIIKRSQTKISAKAQRKVAREIKTARALGLMPFTTMGKKQFFYGRNMEEDLAEEYVYDFVDQKDGAPDENAEPGVEAA